MSNLLSHGLLVKAMNERFDGRPNNSYKPSKPTISDEINELKQQLLESLKRDTSILPDNGLIDIILNIDTDGIERLYFHIQNMRYNEEDDRTDQQDCYGTIDKDGLVELYKSRDELTPYSSNWTDEEKRRLKGFSKYNDEQKRRIKEIKSILAKNKEKLKEEEKEWNAKSFFEKLRSRVQGKAPTGMIDLKQFLIGLPKKFEEQGNSFINSLHAIPTQQGGETQVKQEPTNTRLNDSAR